MISHRIKTGEKLDFDFTEELLNQFHFNLTDFVSEPGEFAVRGGIVDVFSYSNEKPFRITFFGNEIESIKTFDIETQLSVEKVDEFQLVSNINLSTQGEKVPFFDLLPSDSLIIIKNAYSCLDKIETFYQKAQNQFDKLSKTIKHREPHELFLSSDEFSKCFQKFRTIDFSNSPSSKIIQLSQTPQPSFHKNFELLIEDLITKKEQGYEVWISFSSEKQKDRLTEIIETLATKHQQDAVNHLFTAFQSELHEGFVDSRYKIAVYTDHQIFDRYQRFKTKDSFAKSEHLTLKDLMQLQVGDYITHIDHGIGKFMGLVKVNNDGKTQECFKLSYKNGDLLYVSIHSLHKISKYNGSEEKEIALSKLGSPAWKNLKHFGNWD